jgi:PAT family beta-lactamase induction signal transducer AmpG
MANFLRVMRNPRLLVVLLLGFSSGLPLLLIGGTMRAWMTERGLDLKTIGYFSLVGLPYTWKFIWSPLADRYTLLPIGRRRSWLLVSQVGVALSLVMLSQIDPHAQTWALAGSAFVVAFFSATQDIVIDAYRREILSDDELGIGSSLNVLGYRLALLVAGAGALFFADHVAWTYVYWAMAGLMMVGILTTLFCPEPTVEFALPKTLRESIVRPFVEFMSRDRAWTILAFVLLYKIGESLASDMFNPFFLKLGFSKTEIAGVAKVFGVWATIIGSLVGGALLVRLNTYRALWIFGLLQSCALLLFSLLAHVGAHLPLLAVAIGAENFTSGMATTAFVAFMALQSDKQFTATQFALLSSLTGVSRAVLGASSGVLAESLGWPLYFVACAAITIPGLVVLLRLPGHVATPNAARTP